MADTTPVTDSTPGTETRSGTAAKSLRSDDTQPSEREVSRILRVTTSGVKKSEAKAKPEVRSLGEQVKSPKNVENALYQEEEQGTLMTTVLRSFTVPGPKEKAVSEKTKVELGTFLGVYLPTVQNIIGASVFMRLLWVAGVAGAAHCSLILFVMCLCTFLTSISLSAVATNGEVKAGGAYYMLSRNLGPSFGAVVGVLFFLANAVCCAMCLAGVVEIVLVYIFPVLTIGGKEAQSETDLLGMMSNNIRLYATGLLIIQFCIVAIGVKFVQLLAPVSFLFVVVSILACFAGGVEKAFFPGSSIKVCISGKDRLLQSKVVLPAGVSEWKICDYCNTNNTALLDKMCPNGTCKANDGPLQCIDAFPGVLRVDFMANFYPPSYPAKEEYVTGMVANKDTDVYQDASTDFFVMLAIFFPAVAGILTGANMSGDLKNPSKSIPRGTIAADLTISFVYYALAFLYSATVEGHVMRDKYGYSMGGAFVASYMAWPSKWVILVGACVASFGAGLQCLCGAPRLLQALAKDDVISFLKPFEKVTKNNEPFLGLLVSTALAEMAILLGAMDSIAIVVDMCFLMCYAFVNLTCAFFSIMRFPNWRPRYTFYHWSLSVLGGVLCIFIMFTIGWYYAIASILVCAFIYQYSTWTGAKKEWGDGLRGLALSTAQYSIKNVDENTHPKNFRPQLLILFTRVGQSKLGIPLDTGRLRLLQFASQLKAGKGLCIVVALLAGDPSHRVNHTSAALLKEELEGFMTDCQLGGFSKAVIYQSSQLKGCVSTLIQSVGLGGLRPNTMLLKWPMYHSNEACEDDKGPTELATFVDKLYAAVAMDMCILLAKNINEFPISTDRIQGQVDVYWIVQDGGMCLLIAYLLTKHKVWRNCTIRVIAIAQESDEVTSKRLEEELRQYVYNLRIDAQILVVSSTDPQLKSVIMPPTADYRQDQHAVLESWDESEVSILGEKKGADTTEAGGEKKAKKKKEGEHLTPSEQKRRLENAKKKLSKMEASVRLNQLMVDHSSNSELILLNLPKPPSDKAEVEDYIQYLEVLTGNLFRLVLVRASGGEKITALL